MTASKFRDPPCTRFEFTKGGLLYGFLVRSKDPLVNPKRAQGGSRNFEAEYGESKERYLHDALG